MGRDGNRYASTPLGEYVSGAFLELHDRMRTAGDLRALLPWFPLGELDVRFDLEILTGARITAATPEDPMAPMARVLEIERESATTSTLADRLPEPCIKARHEAVVDGTQTCELVTTPAVIESVVASSYAEPFEEIVAADRSTVFVSDGDVEPGGVYDGTGYLIVADDRDVNVGVIESDGSEFLDHLTETFAEHRDGATRLTASALESDRESIRTES